MQLGAKYGLCVLAGLVALGRGVQAQDAQAIVEKAASMQIAADRDDQSHWRYLETELGGNKYVVVETQYGALKRQIDEDGHPASEATLAQDDGNNQRFIHDPALQQKQRQNGAHDDKESVELLKLLPEAFVWKVDSETPELITLSYRPNPNFSPPDMEARVMGSMTGTLVVTKPLYRIKTFKGRLDSDVTIGFGLLARIKAGSNFDIERREVAPGHWQITQTHVHVSGHALFFKTIGTQEDEVKSDFSQVPDGTTLLQALEMLKSPAK
jgi:hypothetical protein